MNTSSNIPETVDELSIATAIMWGVLALPILSLAMVTHGYIGGNALRVIGGAVVCIISGALSAWAVAHRYAVRESARHSSRQNHPAYPYRIRP